MAGYYTDISMTQKGNLGYNDLGFMDKRQPKAINGKCLFQPVSAVLTQQKENLNSYLAENY